MLTRTTGTSSTSDRRWLLWIAMATTAHTDVRQGAMFVAAVPPAVRRAEARVDDATVSGASSVSRSVEKTLKSQTVMN